MPSAGKMSDLTSYRWVKCDIHGCLSTAEHAPDLGSPKPGAVAFVKAVLAVPGWGLLASCGGFRSEGNDFKAKCDRWFSRYFGIDRETDRLRYVSDDRYIITINDRGVELNDDWPAIQKLTLDRIKRAEKENDPDVAH